MDNQRPPINQQGRAAVKHRVARRREETRRHRGPARRERPRRAEARRHGGRGAEQPPELAIVGEGPLLEPVVVQGAGWDGRGRRGRGRSGGGRNAGRYGGSSSTGSTPARRRRRGAGSTSAGATSTPHGDEGRRGRWMLLVGDPPRPPACPRGYPTTWHPSWNWTKSSLVGPACPVLFVPIDVEPRNSSGERLRTKIRRRAPLRSRRRRQVTTSPNRPPARPARSPCPGVRAPFRAGTAPRRFRPRAHRCCWPRRAPGGTLEHGTRLETERKVARWNRLVPFPPFPSTCGSETPAASSYEQKSIHAPV